MRKEKNKETNQMKQVMVVNNTNKNVMDDFRKYFVACANGDPLPEEIADIFSVEVIEENGVTKVIVDFVED